MKKFILSAVLAVVSCSAFAQFNVGSSTSTRTDMFGNTVTTHRDSYGRTTGTSTTGRTDMFFVGDSSMMMPLNVKGPIGWSAMA